MSGAIKDLTSEAVLTLSPTSMKSSSFSLNPSFKVNESNPVKNISNSKFTRSLYSSSSLRIKKITDRPSFVDLCDILPSESQISLYSIGSLSTDDFNWSTFRPNYLKMMNDTNLLDSCAEAKQEMESIHQQSCARRLEFFETDKSKNKKMLVDAEQLLKWINYMEKYLSTFSPTWIEVKNMNLFERNTRLNEQCDLRQYIASHNRIVGEMIREQDNQRTRNIKEKYQILLLNAIEKQCLLEGPELRDHLKSKSYDNEDDVKLDVYKLCSIDIEPQNNLDQLLDYTITQSTESLAMKSDTSTVVTSHDSRDDGIHFSTYPTTSKSSLFSEDQYSPFSSNLDFRPEYESLDNLIKELDDIELNYSDPTSNVVRTDRKYSSSSFTQSTLKLIEDVDLMLPQVPISNIDEFSITNKKVDNWLLTQHTLQLKENQIIKVKADVSQAVRIMDQQSSNAESDRSSIGSNFSVGQLQWDNFQDIYTLSAPYYLHTSDDFLYFGNDYDDVLKSKSGSTISSISEIVKSNSTPSTSPSKSEKSSQIPIEVISISRKRKRIARKLIKQKTVIVEKFITYDNCEMARDILLITENLRSNYMNVKPKDFDGILKICRENLGCLIVVLDKEQRSHSSTEFIECVGNDDKIYILENCRCGIIGSFIASLVNFLYECSRKVRKTKIYKYLIKMLKNLYSMVKFLSERVRVYRNYYGKF